MALNDALRRALAETWAFYFKAHSFHWNVEGPLFAELHSLFGSIYDDAHDAVDGLAERIRTLGERAPASLDEIVAPASIRGGGAASAGAMVIELLDGNEAVAAALRDANAAALAANDQGVANYLQGRLDMHAKWRWMLTATAA